jgi:hypothetical protein
MAVELANLVASTNGYVSVIDSQTKLPTPLDSRGMRLGRRP